MSLPSFWTQTADVYRGAPVADHGTTVLEFGDTPHHTLTGLSIVPQAGTEQLGERDSVITRWTLLGPPDADLTDRDQVAYRGDRYEVDGSVQRWETGVLDHIQATLTRVEG